MEPQPSQPANAIEQVRVSVLADGRMDRRNAAKYLGYTEKTLAMWEYKEPTKLKSVKIGGKRWYYKDTLDAFIQSELAA